MNYVKLEPGWLQRQIATTRAEVAEWPDSWKETAVNMTKRHQVSIPITAELKKQIDQRAAAAGVTRTSWCHAAIVSCLNGTPINPVPRPTGLAATSERKRKRIATAGGKARAEQRNKESDRG